MASTRSMAVSGNAFAIERDRSADMFRTQMALFKCMGPDHVVARVPETPPTSRAIARAPLLAGVFQLMWLIVPCARGHFDSRVVAQRRRQTSYAN